MNKKEELKAHIIKCCIYGNMTVKQAANRLGFSERYVKKLKARYKEYGVSSMLHGNCGRQPKRTLDIALKQKILDTRKEPEFKNVNVMHFKDILQEKCNITVGDINKYTLHGLIDDASGQITGLYMCKNECMQGYFEVLRQTLKNFGVPESIYADGSSIFFTTKKDKLTLEEQLSGVEKPNTQFGKTMDELGIHLIHAGSSQAKGRIERLWNTLHDRLITEFRINNITNMEQANIFLKEYVKKYNKKFKVKPKDKKKAFIPLLKSINLDTLLTVKYKRTVDNGHVFHLTMLALKLKILIYYQELK